MKINGLTQTVLILILGFLVVCALFFAKPFLVPFCIAAIFAMLFLKMNRWLESKGMSRGITSLISVLLLLIAVAGIVTLISWQIAGLAENSQQIEKNLNEFLQKGKDKLESTFGITSTRQTQMIEEQQASGGGGVPTMLQTFMSGLSSFLVDTILFFVYVFLFLYLRSHIRQFILRITPTQHKSRNNKIIDDGSKVTQKYLSGLAMMIGLLWVMYGIGFSIAGVKNAIFFAILCGLLEIIPFIGNVTGTAITIIASLATGGDAQMVISILIVYAVVQFVQTYLLEPLVVGAEISINPLFTIIAIVAGELIWGIPGMVVALPALGMLKVVFDNVEELKPYGFLIGKQEDEKSIKSKFTKLFKK